MRSRRIRCPGPDARHLARARAVLEQAQDDATILAIRDMETAGIDIVSDGEIRRESYSNRFATALEGIDNRQPEGVASPNGHSAICRASSQDPPHRADRSAGSRFPAPEYTRQTKITLRTVTMAQQAHNEFYATTKK